MIRITPYSVTSDTIKKAEKRIFSPFHNGMNSYAKRAFDLLAAMVGLIVLLPFWSLIAILIKRDSPGPVFFRGTRVGKDGKLFKILKFRTMYERPESYSGPSITCKDDNRITPFGHWLRDSKINELPQLWNVLVGEMSLVGPRPECPELVITWPEDVRREILSVRPGITGPASILYHDEEQMLAIADLMRKYVDVIMPDKLRLYQLYVRNHSFVLDLDLILLTFAIFLPRMEKNWLRESNLFAGPLSRLTTRHLSWFIVDLIISLCAVTIAGFLWRSHEPLNWGVENLFWLSIIVAFLFSGINSISGVNRIVWPEALAEDATGLVISSGSVTVLLMILNYLQSLYHWFPYPALPTSMLFTVGLLASIGFVAVRYRWRLLPGFIRPWFYLNRSAAKIAERVLIVGSGEGTAIANWILNHGPGNRLFTIVGLVDPEKPTFHGMRMKGNTLLGGIADLPDLIEQHDVGVVVFAIPNASAEVTAHIAGTCIIHDIRLVMLSDLINGLQQQLIMPSRANQV